MMFEQQLERTLTLVEDHKRAPQYLETHYESMLTLIRQGFRLFSHTSAPKLIALIASLDPLPIRWRQHINWLDILREATELAGEQKNYAKLCQFHRSQARIFFLSGNFKAALTSIENAIHVAEKHALSTALLEAHLLKFDILGFMEREKDPEKACDMLEAILQQQKPDLHAAEFSIFKGQILLRRGNSLRFRNRYQQALENVHQGFELIADNVQDDPEVLALAYKYRLGINESLENYEQAIADNQKINEYYKALGDRFSEIDSLGDLGLIYWRTGQYAKAEQTLQESIQMAEESKAQWWLARQLGNQGLVQFTRGNLAQAVELIDQQRKIGRLTGNLSEEKRAISNGAFVKIFLGQKQAAYNDLMANLTHIKKHKYHLAEGIVSANLAWAVDDIEQGREYAQSALKIAEQTNSTRLKIIALRALSELQDDVEQKQKLAQETLLIAEKRGRHLNQAGALFTLSTCLTGDKRKEARKKAESILQFLGAENWLYTEDVFDTKRLPLLL